MIPPLRFFWSKILPISYDNYLSETEILEFMRHRLDQCILEINKIEEYIQNQLNTDISDIAKDEILQYHKDTVLPLIKDLQTAISSLQSDIELQLQNLKDAMQACCDRMDKRIDKVQSDMDRFTDDVARLQLEINQVIDKVQTMVKDLENKVDFNREWMEKSLMLSEAKWLRMLNNQYVVIKNWCRDYFNHLASEALYVINPITGKQDLLNNVLADMFNFNSGGLTCWEFRDLYLTCEQFRSLGLTAYEFRVYGIHGIQGEKPVEVVKMYDLYGHLVEQPLSSVWGVFGHGVHADMDKWDITAEQFRELSDRITEYNLEKWGRYYLSNHGTAVLKDVVYLESDTISVTEYGVQEISGILKLKEDNGIVDTQELLQDVSLEHLVHSENVEVVGWSDGLYSLAINKFELVEGGIAFNGYVNNGCRMYEDGVAMPCTILIDVVAHTSTIGLEIGGV